MPSEFVRRPGQTYPKTLEDLLERLTQGPRNPRMVFFTTPTAPKPPRMKTLLRRRSNQDTEQQRRQRAAQEALRALQPPGGN